MHGRTSQTHTRPCRRFPEKGRKSKTLASAELGRGLPGPWGDCAAGEEWGSLGVIWAAEARSTFTPRRIWGPRKKCQTFQGVQ